MYPHVSTITDTQMTSKFTPEMREAIEHEVGMPIEEIRRLPLEDWRTHLRSTFGCPLKFVSRFPFIGRGNVLRDKIVSHDQVERELDEALK